MIYNDYQTGLTGEREDQYNQVINRKGNGTMKKVLGLLICVMLLGSFAAAEQTVTLANSRYTVDVPDDMEYSAAEETESGMEAYYSDTIEMDYVSYPKSAAKSIGMGETLQETAEKLMEDGNEIELRDVNGIEMVCFRVTDREDGAPCIGYVFEDGDWMIEIDFWYATQEAADRTTEIISSIRAN